MARGKNAGNRNQGSNWCSKTKRARIYARDNHRCVWCNESIEPGVNATIDHVLPRSKGGGNSHYNLVTACKTCNRLRGNRSALEFAMSEELARQGLGAGAILVRVLAQADLPLPELEAEQIKAA